MEMSGKKIKKKRGIGESPASAAALHLGRAGAFVFWGVKLETADEVKKGKGRLKGWELSGERVLGGRGEIGAPMPR